MANQDKVKAHLNKRGDRRGMSPNSQKNLGIGRKGNNHAKKDYSITRIIKEMLDNPIEERWLEIEDKKKQFTWRQAIAKRILIEAVKGNAKVTGELLDRLEGKVAQPVTGAGGGPIRITHDADALIKKLEALIAVHNGQ